MSDKFLNGAGVNQLRSWVEDKLTRKQDTLVSGTNIKTINGSSVLGSGDLTISGLQNLVDGIATGSVRGINTAVEDSSYTIGQNAFAEGHSTKASGNRSHAEGHSTTASGSRSHAEGYSTTASGFISHAEGRETTASGVCSHAQNLNTVAGYEAQTAIGKYNENKTNTAFEIGNGTAYNARSNALTVDWNGEIEIALNTTAASGTDKEIYDALVSLGWDSDVIV